MEGQEGQPQPWLCPKCGKEQPVGHKFCTTCGVDQSGNEAESRDNVVFGKLPTKSKLRRQKQNKKANSFNFKNMGKQNNKTTRPRQHEGMAGSIVGESASRNKVKASWSFLPILRS